MARGTRCTVHHHDAPTAEERHHLQPQSRGGSNAADNMRWLCANGHGDVHYFLDLIEKYRDPAAVPWSLAKHYGPAVRATAVEGWSRYAEAFLSGRLSAQVYFWTSAGLPVEGRPDTVPPYGLAASVGTVDTWLAIAQIRKVERE